MTPTAPLISAHPNGEHSTASVTGVIERAFIDLPPARWLVPPPIERGPLLAFQFRGLVNAAHTHGRVWVSLHPDTHDLIGAAVWITHDPDRPAPPPDHHAYGPYAHQFAAFDRVCGDAFAATRPAELAPTTPVEHLALLAVHPDHQGRGIGTALLTHHHDQVLDPRGRYAYLDAAGPDAARLYHRHGYRAADPVPLPDGPEMTPMWRAPHTTTRARCGLGGS